MAQVAATPTNSQTKIFLSYSRKDAAFLDRIQAALVTRGYAPIYDRSEHTHDDYDLQLSAQDEWWRQLQTMIAASDVMVFVVTPDSAKSPVCDDEIAYAKGLGKRVIAILRRDTDFNKIPERLRALNVKLDFRADDKAAFTTALAALTRELEENIDWRRRGAHFARLAQKWHAEGRPEAQLLRAGAVDDADAWASRRPAAEPEPGPILLAFLDASREKEKKDTDARRRLIQRGFALAAQSALADGRPDAALRRMAAAAVLSDDIDFSLEADTGEPHKFALWRSALKAVQTNPLAVLRGHENKITRIAFSPDGARILTASADHTARLWDSVSGEQIAALRGHESTIACIAFSPDGTRLATGSWDKTVRVWDAARGVTVATLPHGNQLMNIAFSPDGGGLLACGDATAEFWDVDTAVRILALDHESGVHNVAFSADGMRALTATVAKAWIWDVRTGDQIAMHDFKSAHRHGLHSAALSPDGARILTAPQDDTPRIWDATTGEELAALNGHEAELCRGVFSPDGERALTASRDGTARLWDAKTGRETAVFRGHRDRVTSVAFSPDGGRVLTGSWDNSVRLWDAETGAEMAVLRGHADPVQGADWLRGRLTGADSVAFNSSGTRILTIAADNTARLYDAAARDVATVGGYETGDPFRNFARLAFSPDGERLVTGGPYTARLRHSSAGEEIAALRGESRLMDLAFSPDGARIVTGYRSNQGAGAAVLWDGVTGREVKRLKAHTGSVDCVALSSTRALTGSSNGRALLWDAKTGAEIAELGRGEQVALSADGAYAVTGGQLFDGRTGDEIAPLPHPSGRGVGLIVFRADGTRFLTGCSDETTRIWDVTGAQNAALPGQPTFGQHAAWSPDGTRVLTCLKDGNAQIWDATTGGEIATLHHTAEAGDVAFSYNGALALTCVRDGTARLWDAATGAELAALAGPEDAFSVAISPSGDRVAIGGKQDSARLWDVAWSTAFEGDRAVFLAAALDCGVGRRSADERSDLLMQDAPDDLFAAMMERMTGEQRERVARTSRVLRAPKHPNCYLAPSQRPESAHGAPSPPKAQPLAVQRSAHSPGAADGRDDRNKAAAPVAPPSQDVRAASQPMEERVVPSAPRVVARKGMGPLTATILVVLAVALGAGALVLLRGYHLLE